MNCLLQAPCLDGPGCFAPLGVDGVIDEELLKHPNTREIMNARLQAVENEFFGLEDRLRRHPSNDEMAEALGLEPGEYCSMLEEVHRFSVLSLKGQESEGRDLVAEILSKCKAGDEPERMGNQLQQVISVVAGLPEMERLVMTLLYYEELNLKEVGVVLNISRQRVLQLHSQALLKIHDALVLLT